MNYKIKNDNGVFKIFETATDQIIVTFLDQKEAKQTVRHLNFGGGFDGWTPAFMLKKVVQSAEKSAKAV